MNVGPGRLRKVAIIGAGPSGLVAAKELLENGLIPTIFEQKCEIGGVWSPTGAVWDTMHTNISKFTTTYGDFHWHQDAEMFPSVQAMLDYLNDYARQWNIKSYIKFNSSVIKVLPNSKEAVDIGSKGWTVQWTDNDFPSTLQSDSFEGVIVATGIFCKANIPTIPGLHSFSGKIIHSKDYKSGKAYAGLKVLTVGGSFSGAEIASDVSNHCDVSYHCFRDPFWILRRYLPDKKRESVNIPIDLIFYTRGFYELTPVSDEESNISKNRYMSSICQDQLTIAELAIESEHFGRPHNVTVSDQYLFQVQHKKLIPKNQQISEISGSTVVFQNGDILEVDAIIFCTGYNAELGFFDENVLQKICYDQTDRLQPIILFKECCHPELKNLFFVGMYKGPYFAVMEQQARLAARVLSGSVVLPSLAVMLDGLKREKAIRDARPRLQFPHPEYVHFADEISQCADSFPDLNKFKDTACSLSDSFGKPLKDDALYLEEHKSEIYERFMTEPVIPSHYNLVRDPIGTLNRMDLVQEAIKRI